MHQFELQWIPVFWGTFGWNNILWLVLFPTCSIHRLLSYL